MTEKMIIAYVHDPPAKQSIETRWREPNFLFEQGFTDLVIADQMTGCCSLVMDEAEKQIKQECVYVGPPSIFSNDFSLAGFNLYLYTFLCDLIFRFAEVLLSRGQRRRAC